MKKCSVLLVSLLAFTGWAQSDTDEEISFSLDVGASAFLTGEETGPIASLLTEAGNEQASTSETGASPYLGVNLHWNRWSFGIAVQRKYSWEVASKHPDSPLISVIEGENSWMSIHAERSFDIGGNMEPFVALGWTDETSKIAASNLPGSVSSEEFQESVESTGAFIRGGVGLQLGVVQGRVDYTYRNADTPNDSLVRFTIRVSSD